MSQPSESIQFLIDTGPLLALLSHRDKHHEWIKEQLAETTRPLLTCEAVLSEVVFLLKRQSLAVAPLAHWLQQGFVQVESLADKQARISNLLNKYADLPTSYADASLVALSEMHGQAPLLTIDADFRIYRRDNRRVVPIRIPT